MSSYFIGIGKGDNQLYARATLTKSVGVSAR